MSSKIKGASETVHQTVTCDICKTEAIEGNRYKCAVCENFDICDICFLNRKHSEHPMIKLKDLKYEFEEENFDNECS